MKTTKLIMLAVLALFPLLANAEKVQIDGIWYDLVSKDKMAKVTFADDGTTYNGKVVIPETVTHEDVVYSVTSIGEEAFYECPGLTSITIPNSVTGIGNYAFSECTGLTSITIPNSVASIGCQAFYSCTGLTSITIGNSVTSIEEEAFIYCTSLTSVHITDLAAWCNIDFKDFAANPLCYAKHLYFEGEEVKDLVIPNTVTSIGSEAFRGCSGLTSITIPNSVTNIGHGTFQGCTGLTNITIPNSVTSIGNNAFDGCSGLTSITIPNSVTNIGHGTFQGCTGLTNITIPNSVTSIGSSAFDGCTGLTSITIPNSVTSIGFCAFDGCSGLTSITIPNSVASIEYGTFGYCTDLTDVYCYAEKVPSTKDEAFRYSYIEYATLHVPESAIDTYKATAPWSGFGTIKPLSGEAVEVEKCATPTISYHNGNITVSGDLADGTAINVYNISGMAMGNATVKEGKATISTSLQAGDVAIVNVGAKHVKVVMK